MFGFDAAVINGGSVAIRETFGMGAGFTGFVVASALPHRAMGAWLADKLAVNCPGLLESSLFGIPVA
jgi:MFS transporter, SP family, sugar:H+ symporter